MMAFPQVVRVYATSQEPDYDCPWQAQRPESSTGSGVLIAKGRVLTGAHVIANATFLQVQTIANPNKSIARVCAVCHDSDLALLEVEDPTFAEGIEPAPIGSTPQRQDRVSVVGFPIGGEEISITEGVVSRVEVQRYRHSKRHLLAITVDAAINEGNSGGPVFQGDQVAGIAFQKLNKADNIGEMVPAPLLHQFLDGIAKQKPPYVPGLSISSQGLENPTLRASLKLPENRSGVMVTSIECGGSCWGHLQKRDVLLSIGGMTIANNGTIFLDASFRTRYDAALCSYHVGDLLTLEVLRDGAIQNIELRLKPMVHLIPRSQYDVRPTYFVFGGFVFQPLTQNFISTWNRWSESPAEFQYFFEFGERTPAQQEVIVLTQVLSDAINTGYEDLYDESIRYVNGETPKDMADFVRLVSASQDTIEITMSGGGVIALNAAEVAAANPRILGHYKINEDRSPDLQSPDDT